MGICIYDFVYTCGNFAEAGLQKFIVRTANERLANWGHASAVKYISLDVDGNEFKLEKNSVFVDSLIVHPPYRYTSSSSNVEVFITLSCGYLVIRTNFGLVIRYDRSMRATVELSKEHRGLVCGLCGNFNGNPNDDFVRPSGELTTNLLQFGNSHRSKNIIENKFCPAEIYPPASACKNENQLDAVTQICNVMRLHESFVECHRKINPDNAIEDCIFDQCINLKDKRFSCNIIKRYAENCQRADPTISIDWVEASGCVLSCPRNEHYKKAATVCEKTCANLQAHLTCVPDKRPSCVCNDGYVRSGLVCVPLARCGCKGIGGQYHQLGESWLTKDCRFKFTCARNGWIVKKPFRCLHNSECKPRNSGTGTEYICEEKMFIPPGTCGALTNAGTCSATGDPHYKTFDQRAYDFQGSCTYDFAYPCRNSSKNNLQDFLIRTSNEAYPRWVGVTAIHTVTLVLRNMSFAINRANVQVENFEVHPPYLYKFEDGLQVTITKACGYVQIGTNFGLLIRYDMKMNLYVDLSRVYEGRMCGLCGNFNGNSTDDIKTKQGLETTNIVQFANSYRSIGVVKMSKCQIFATEPPASCGAPYQKTAIENRCSLLLTDLSYKQCHSRVAPQVYYNECVYDQCRDIYNPIMSCNVFEHYALECKKRADINIKWKTISGCLPVCRKYEVFVEGSPICDNTCGNPNARDFCNRGRHDGCVCLPGFVRSGLTCVPIHKCGCTDENGIYHRKGDVWLTNNCTTKNTCIALNKIISVTFPGCEGSLECQRVDAFTSQCAIKIPTCGADEHYDEFKPVCENTCNNPDYSNRCKNDFSPGCSCDEGFIRHNKICIPISQCGCVDGQRNYYDQGSSWLSPDCTLNHTCNAGGEIRVAELGPCDGICTSIEKTFRCVKRPIQCKDTEGNLRPIGSTWTSNDCSAKFTCLESGETTRELLPTCSGVCVRYNSNSGVDYRCEIISVTSPPPPSNICKDEEGKTRVLGSAWRSSCCHYIYRCQCDGNVNKTRVAGCEPGSTCKQVLTSNGADYYCSYETQRCFEPL